MAPLCCGKLFWIRAGEQWFEELVKMYARLGVVSKHSMCSYFCNNNDHPVGSSLTSHFVRNGCWVWSVKNLNLSDRWDQIDAICAADNVVLFRLRCICHAKWSDWLSWWAQQSTAGTLPDPTAAPAVTKQCRGGGTSLACSPIVLPPLPVWSIIVQYLFHSSLNTVLTGSG